ncbi:MAG: chromosomal replication initiator protein DnaA [Deltaproteobacteria bacterium]|nr:MAG: chromosomal replication initiator protein DnaA [Deltaproteobacteria bacterium]
MEQFWKRVLEELEKTVPSQTFSTWISPLEPLEIKGDLFLIAVPNRFFIDWLKDQNLVSSIADAVEVTIGTRLEVGFEVKKKRLSKEAALKAPERGVDNWKDRSLKIGLNPRHTFESFVVGPSNEFANAASLAVAKDANSNYNPLFIYGGVGLGKTHLLNAIGNHKLQENPNLKICFVTSESFTNELIQSLANNKMSEFRAKYRSMDVLLVDDIQFLARKERTQEEFFHTFNALYERQKSIVLSSDKFPKEIPDLESRLRSRFEWGLIADIQAPDVETKVAILHKKAQLESIDIPNDVAMYLATIVSSNIRELEGSLTRVAAFANLTRTRITLELAKKVLQSSVSHASSSISVDEITKAVSNYFKIKISEIKGKRRTRAIAWARQISMFLSRELTDSSCPEIGQRMGGKDHSTVMYACDKVKELIENDPDVAHQIESIKGSLGK